MALSVLIVILTIFSTNISFLKEFQAQAVWIMLSFLGIGMIAYLFNNRNILYVSFACCASLCVFLKSASNSNLKMPEENNETKVSIAHVNVTSAEESYESLTNELLKREIDILSFQEVKPDWARYLQSALKETHPYIIENIRIDLFGMAIYSKFPITKVDTAYAADVPFLTANIELKEDKELCVISTMMLPSINKRLDSLQTAQMENISNYIKENQETELVLGDFNMVYWSNKIRDFRENASLLNSRRDVSQSVLSVPYDHIFHSSDLECTQFRDIIDTTGNRLGIVAHLQYFNKTSEL